MPHLLTPLLHLIRPFRLLALAGAGLLLAAAWIAGLAHPAPAPQAQVSPIHPVFPLLDAAGENVLASGAPVSTHTTCGSCHDTDFISTHSGHASLGFQALGDPGASPGSRPWETGPGFFGRWDPLLYRYLSPAGDPNPDLTLPAWVQELGLFHAGGGPALLSPQGQPLESLPPGSPLAQVRDPNTGLLVPWDWAASGTVEMNCFLCHTPQPDNAARIQALREGRFAWANTATLLASGIVEQAGADLRYNPAAFSPTGDLLPQALPVQDPTNDNCAQCHGRVHTSLAEPVTVSGCSPAEYPGSQTGVIISPQRISASGLNLAGKASQSRPFDVHAERLVECTDCHPAANNPASSLRLSALRPEHLRFDPRRLEIGEYLEKPVHALALSREVPADPTLPSACAACHNLEATHTWLPYKDRHFNALACETCHIPTVPAPAVQQVDWSVLTAAGEPYTECRGLQGEPGSSTALTTGYQPVVLARSTPAGEKLAPYNLVAASYWVYGEPPRPVPLHNLQAAWLEGGEHAPALLPVFDQDASGRIEAAELRLDTPEKVDLLAGRLAAQGLEQPRLWSEVEAHPLHHGVAPGAWATRDCRVCHSADSILAAGIPVAGFQPGPGRPDWVSSDGVSFPGEFSTSEAGELSYRSIPSRAGLYILGHDFVAWVDLFGALALTGTLLGVLVHGSLRFISTLRRPRHTPRLKKVYMYAVYERFWHWLQTFVILGLLFTGLVIHRPATFGIFSFQQVVLVHNVLAAILVINAGLSLFYHLASGEIRQFIPRPAGFFDQAIQQGLFYLRGIFRGDPHPFEKSPSRKMNPLQQATYFAILNVLLPLQVISGALMWGAQRWPELTRSLGGLPFLGPAHTLIAWTFASFIIMHVYLTTTGHAPLAGIQAMMQGWDEVETPEPLELKEEPTR